jgi:hypothetical protein
MDFPPAAHSRTVFGFMSNWSSMSTFQWNRFISCMDVHASDVELHCRRFDEAIQQAGGFDLGF